MMVVPTLVAAFLVGGTIAASACSPAFSDRNRRTAVAQDCSFKYAGDQDFFSGYPAIDLGRGRIGQEIFPGFLGHEFVVADCTTSEVVAIAPPDIPGTETSCGFDTDVSVVTPPKAKYDNRSEMSDIVADARSRGLNVNLAIQAINNRFKKRDQVNLFCGCKIFYPESIGATQ
ncbi:hypothetical protein [uncultured Litoreibacter sp.]|uniref:hypothetical protein n=1 Tax=uncultured Litoreibacter sp. TaxID=1392394 RepID=UPI002628E027|nr:hypothetical protein [uncultured Litoreibacter sp.]